MTADKHWPNDARRQAVGLGALLAAMPDVDIHPDVLTVANGPREVCWAPTGYDGWMEGEPVRFDMDAPTAALWLVTP